MEDDDAGNPRETPQPPTPQELVPEKAGGAAAAKCSVEAGEAADGASEDAPRETKHVGQRKTAAPPAGKLSRWKEAVRSAFDPVDVDAVEYKPAGSGGNETTKRSKKTNLQVCTCFKGKVRRAAKVTASSSLAQTARTRSRPSAA